MAFTKVESKSFSGAQGFWKPESKGDEFEGILIKAALPKKGNPFLVFELTKDTQCLVKNEAKKLKKGARVGVNYFTQLDGLLDHVGRPCKIVFQGKRKIEGGRTVADWDMEVDFDVARQNLPPISEQDRSRLEKRQMMKSNGAAEGDVPF